MNTKTLFKLGSVLLVLLLLTGTVAFGQVRTWFVNNSTGNDSRNGLAAAIPSPDDGFTGPKRTIARAITEGNDLDLISVEGTGIGYSTTTGEPATIQVIDKRFTFTSTTAAPIISSVFQLAFTTTPPAAQRVVTFTGAFNLNGGLLMTRGNIVGGSYLTLGGTVTFIAYPSGTANPAIDVAPAGYAASVNFAYDAQGVAANVITTGSELNGPSINTKFNNLTVGASFSNVALTFSGSYTMKGLLTTSNTSTINLGGNTLTISGTNLGHSVAGNITNGTLAFAMTTPGASVAGAFALPFVTATGADGVGADLLTLTNATSVGSVTATSDALIVVTAATTIGAASNTTDVVVNHSSGTITLAAATTINGNVVLDAPLGPPTAGNANTGRIIFNAAAAITVNGNVTNNASIALEAVNDAGRDGATGVGVTAVGIGIIWFPDQDVIITGNVSNSFTVGGTISTTGPTTSNNQGQIRFSRAALSVAVTTINGTLGVSSGSAVGVSSGTPAIVGMGSVIIQNAAGDVRIDGGITSTGNWSGWTGAGVINNGRVEILLRTTAKLGLTTNKVGAISNTSVAKRAWGNGDLLLGNATTLGGFNGTTIGVGGATAGGVTVFGSEGISATTVTNSRTDAAVNLQFGVGATAATVTFSNLVSQGTGTTQINSIVGTVFTVSVATTMTTGNVTFPNATNAATFNLGNLTTTGGTLDLSGAGGAITATINVKNATLTGGTINLGTGVRLLNVSGTGNTIGGTAANNVWTVGTGASTTLSFENPVPTAQQVTVIGPLEPTFPGSMQVNNSTGLVDAVRFTGGNFKIAGKVAFLTPGVGYGITLDGADIYVQSVTGALDFNNVNGYATINNGYVSMEGIGTQEVGGAGSFGGFEVNATVAVTVAAATGPFTGFFYLSRGAVYNTGNNTSSANVVFNNTSPYPTIIVNAGQFNVVFTTPPTFTSAVNVVYIGVDKSTSLELPAGATKLMNLTVATTNGAAAGKGVVTTNVSPTVNGILTINAGQTLAIGAGQSLTMKGTSAVINGYLANKAVAVFGVSDRFVLANTTVGTAITGTGVICDVEVANNSINNTISGPVAIINQWLGADGAWLGAADFDATTPAAASGNIQVGTGGSGTESITLTMGAGYAKGTTVKNITTTDANATFTLGSNLVASGILTVTKGTIAMGANNLSLVGVVGHSFDGTGSITGTGLLLFQDGTGLTVTTQDATIGVNVKLLSTSVGPMAFTLAAANNLTLGGTLTLEANSAVNTVTFTLGANLTVTGSAVTMGANTYFAGAGILNLNATATPPGLTFTYTGTPSLANLTISNDVTLAGTGTSLTVTGTLKHVAGILNFGARDLTSSGTYQRTGGSYQATTGYFIYSGTGANFKQGNTGFQIPNLRFANTLNASATGTGVVTVTNMLDVQITPTKVFTLTVSGAKTLALVDGGIVNYTSGAFDVMPAYGATINLVALNVATGGTIDLTVWPDAMPTLVSTFTVNSALATDVVTIPGDRQVNVALKLTRGVLDLGLTAARTLTMVNNSSIYRTFGGSLLLASVNTGVIVYGTSMTLVYQADGAAAGFVPANSGIVPAALPNFITGPELPATIANLTFTRASGLSTNAWTVINSNVTITGTLTIKNDVITPDQETLPGPVVSVNVAGNLVVATDAGAGATAPFVKIGTLAFTGGLTQSATLVGPLTLTNLTLNMPAGGQVNVVGGSISVFNLVFIRGLLVVPAPYAVILAGHGPAGQGFNHTGVLYPNLSHVVGNVQEAVASGDGQAGTNGRFEFPVGGMLAYRPMAITFTPAYVANNPTNLIVSMVDNSPDGVRGMPIDGGNGVRIGNYPQYYWLVTATPSSFTSTQAFDVDLQGTNLGYPFTSEQDLRIIRRQDGNAVTNQWQVQGTATNYTNNYISVQGPGNIDSSIFVRASSAQGGIVFQATRFTIGIPTRPPIFTVAPTILTVDEGQTLSTQYTGVSQNANLNQTITYSLNGAPAGMVISSTGLLTWSPGYGKAGTYTFTVSASDGQFTIPTATITLTVVRVNRAPVFNPRTIGRTLTDKDTLKVALAAVDADTLSTLTYTILSFLPAPTNAASITGSNLTWKPVFADATIGTFVLKVLVSDGISTGHGPTPGVDTLTINVTVNKSRALGDADGNGLVQAADAAMVLQKVAGLITVTDPATLYAMDASKNGSITAFDASLILQAVAGLIPPLTNTVGGLGKVAAWEATGALDMATPQTTTSPEVVTVGLKLSNPSNVYSVEFVTKGDFSQVTIDAVNASLPEGWDMKWNVVGNELRFAAAGTSPLSSGAIASIMVHLKSKESRVNFSTDALLNENFQSLGAVEVAAIPTVYALEQNYPNPFNPSTTIRYQIPNDANVNLIIYNVQGQKIRTLISKEQKAGYYNVVWDGRNEAGQTVSTGLYLYRVQAGSFVATQKMLMLK